MTSILLLSVPLALLWWRIERVLDRKAQLENARLVEVEQNRQRIEERKLALSERELDLKEKDVLKPAPPSDEPIPADLLSSTMSESEPWAKEQKLAAIYELFHSLHDWDKVRHVMTLRGQI